MKRQLLPCWMFVVVELFNFSSGGQTLCEATQPSKANSSNDAGGDPLQIRIDLRTQMGSMHIDKLFRVVVANTSDQPQRIWHPSSRAGYYQLSFQFEDPQTKEKFVARKRKIDDDAFWIALANNNEPDLETVEIAPGDDFTYQIIFNGFKWGEREWQGLPDPNSGQPWLITAQFESAAQLPTSKPVWKGKTHSGKISANLLATRLKTPHEYLWAGFPNKAVEIMKADPKWISRADDDSRQPLHIAARFGHIEAVKWLLDNGADVNSIAYNGFTPLHLTEHVEVVKLILAKKPDLSILNGIQGGSPLQDAAEKFTEARGKQRRKKFREIVDLYLASGAEYDLLTAIYLDDLKRIKAILERSPKLADDFQNDSPLRTAAKLGRLEICRFLINEHRVNVNDFERGIGYPIIKAALAHPQVVRLLIENGADLKKRITWRGHREGYWIIGDEATCLHFAARDGVPDTINMLIDQGVDILAKAEPAGLGEALTALELAACFGKTDNVRAILNHPKLGEIDERPRQDLLDRSLRTAVRTQNEEQPGLIEALLAKGADLSARQGEVALTQVVASQLHPNNQEENEISRKVVAKLVEYGAKVDLFSAVAIGDEARVAQLLRQDVPPDARDRDGFPALHFAVRMGYRGIVMKLIDAGCDVNLRNRSERSGSLDATALHEAAFWGRYEAAKLLIDGGADVNAVTEQKVAPLHRAARMTNVKVARLFLERGADPAIQDEDGKTPLDWCRKLNWTNADEVEKLFREFHEQADKR